MTHELDSVALTRDLPEHGLKRGDVGRIIHRYDSGEAFELEFLAGDGSTLAVVTLEDDDVKPLERADAFHVRTTAGS